MNAPSATTGRPVLLVLGMHRSGTSATAGFLAGLGARMAANPIRADGNNPHGYWEPEPLVSLHNRLLAEVGSAWDDFGPLDVARLAGAREALAAAFTAEFGTDVGLAVLKDPRICRLLPLWRISFSVTRSKCSANWALTTSATSCHSARPMTSALPTMSINSSTPPPSTTRI